MAAVTTNMYHCSFCINHFVYAWDYRTCSLPTHDLFLLVMLYKYIHTYIYTYSHFTPNGKFINILIVWILVEQFSIYIYISYALLFRSFPVQCRAPGFQITNSNPPVHHWLIQQTFHLFCLLGFHLEGDYWYNHNHVFIHFSYVYNISTLDPSAAAVGSAHPPKTLI
jgi:hypothetical protein